MNAAIATANNVFIVLILGSNVIALKSSNIEPRTRPGVAQFRLAFAIDSALFRPTDTGLTRLGALLLSTPLIL